MDPVFDAVACAASSVGLRATRVKDLQGDYRLTDRILALLRAARIVVADLSHDRPNVYFELGYARGLGKTVITILRTGTVPHFDVHDWAYLEYADSRPLERQLRERFRFEIESAIGTTPAPRPAPWATRVVTVGPRRVSQRAAYRAFSKSLYSFPASGVTNGRKLL
jgi:hypothetical protein